MEAEIIWQKIRDYLLESNLIDADVYNIYIREAEVVSFEYDNLVIKTKNNLAKKILNDNFKTFTDVLKVLELNNINITFVTDQENKIINKNIDKIKINNNSNCQLFENFVCGKSNEEAYIACQKVITNLGKIWNPLFIFSESGLGKTHLLKAMKHKINEEYPEIKVLFIKANDFGSNFIQKLQLKKNVIKNDKYVDIENYKNYILSQDVLLLDDIQILANWEKTNITLFNILNTFIEDNKQVVLTSDKNPDELNGFHQRLISRFRLGILLKINQPHVELAAKIIRLKIKNQNIQTEFTDEAINFLAENFNHDVRAIIGALNRISLKIILEKPEIIDLKQLEMFFENHNFYNESRITYKKIISLIGNEYNLSSAVIRSKSRLKNVVAARKICIYLAREILNDSFKKIGQEFNRDHSTIDVSYHQICNQKKQDKKLNALLSKLKDKLIYLPKN